MGFGGLCALLQFNFNRFISSVRLLFPPHLQVHPLHPPPPNIHLHHTVPPPPVRLRVTVGGDEEGGYVVVSGH